MRRRLLRRVAALEGTAEMEQDEEIRREVWEGKIPVCFSVDEREMGINPTPPELCFVSTYAVIMTITLELRKDLSPADLFCRQLLPNQLLLINTG